MILLREIEVENIVRNFLANDGFSVVPRVREQGVDIIARKDGTQYYIEVEGNKKPDGIRPFTTTQKYTHYFRAIGQLAFRISEHPDGVYILALPDDDYYREKVTKTLLAFRKLGVIIYFVTLTGIDIIQ